MKTVCVFCASSRRCDEVYVSAAAALGRDLARRGIALVTGGGSTGLMGAVADASLGAGGRVIGIMPGFMNSIEVTHQRLSDLRVVQNMSDRLDMMLDVSDGFIALPGGCGTLEEIMHVLTRKRLGRHDGPMALVNVRGFFDPLIAMLNRAVHEGFMDQRHMEMWCVAESADKAVDALLGAPKWARENARFAVPESR